MLLVPAAVMACGCPYHCLDTLFPHGVWYPKGELTWAILWYLLSIFLCLPGAFILFLIELAGDPQRSFIDSLYITGTALTTAGFGDIHCNTRAGRLYIMTYSMVLSCFHNYVGFRLIRLLFFVDRLHPTQPPEALVIHKPSITLDHLDHIDQALKQLKTEVAQFRVRVETLAWNTETFLNKIKDIENKQAARNQQSDSASHQ